MNYLYIIKSKSYDKYYVGITSHPDVRLEEHNNSERDLYTKRYRPWELAALYSCGEDLGYAMRVERFIKKQKSRAFIEKLIEKSFEPYGELKGLVRIK